MNKCSMAQYHGRPFRYCPECDWKDDPDEVDPDLAELQVEAIRSLLEDILTTSASPNPAVWAPNLLGQLSLILDARDADAVKRITEERRGAQET